MEAYTCRAGFTGNLKYDWLMMMSLGGAVVSLIMYKVKPSVRVSNLELFVMISF